jgi:hypothetical protein
VATLAIVLMACSSGAERSDSASEAWRRRHDACVPTTCSAQGASCGTIANGCGGTIDCGTCPAPPAGPSLVQQKAASAANVSSFTLTLDAAPRNGSALILAVNGWGAEPSSVVGGGVAWALVSSSCQHECGSLWVGFEASSGGAQLTITWSSVQAGVAATASEWVGLTAVSGSASSNGIGSPASTASLGVAQAGELVFATAATHDTTAGSPSSGFTALAGAAVAAADVQVIGAYLFASSAGSLSTSWPMGNSDGWDTQIVAFATSGAPPADAGSDAPAESGAPDAGSDAPVESGAPSPWPPPLPSGAIEYYVAPTGSDSAAGSSAAPWRTIAHAASAISGGGQPVTVHVAPGTYVLDASSCIASYASGTASAPITFVSDVRGGAKIDGNGACLVIWSQSGNYTNIWGFDFTGTKYAPSDCTGSGGSLVIEAEASGGHVDVGYNVIHDLPWGFAAAVDMDPWGNGGYTGAPSSVHDNVFRNIGNTTPGTSCGPPNNYAIYIASGADTHVYNNLIYNVPTIAIHCWHAANGVYIFNNTVVNAGIAVLAGTGDGGAVAGSRFFIDNNILVGANHAIDVEADLPGSISVAGSTFNNNLFKNNVTDLYDRDNIGVVLNASVNADPLFVSPAAGDFHLSAGSPAINAGTSSGAPDHDLDGFPRPFGAAFDIGAYEWH